MRTFTNFFRNLTTGEIIACQTRAHDLYEARREYLRYMRETNTLNSGDHYKLVTLEGALPLEQKSFPPRLYSSTSCYIAR